MDALNPRSVALAALLLLPTHVGPAAPARAMSVRGMNASADTLFRPYVQFRVPRGARAIGIGDVTGDGRPDLVAESGPDVFSPAPDSLYVLAGAANGALLAYVAYPVGHSGASPYDGTLAIADLNNDGRLDVVISMNDAIGVLFQRPDGTLAPEQAFPTANPVFGQVLRLVAADFNHDGLTDVACIYWGSWTSDVNLYLQAGGTLMPPLLYSETHGGYDDLEAGDVNGDGWMDLVVLSGQVYAIPAFGVLTQPASGGFNAAAYYWLGLSNTNAHAVGIGDVDGDGRDDIAVVYGGNKPSSGLAVFPQLADGTIGGPRLMASYDLPSAAAVADVNMDGRKDVLVLHTGWLALGTYLQDGVGGLTPEALYPLPTGYYNVQGIAVGDLNSDGKPDVAVGDAYGIEVLYNRLNRDIPTATLLQIFDGEALSEGILLRWRIDSDAASVLAVERAVDGEPEWQTLPGTFTENSQGASFLDRAPAPGTRFRYRLRLRLPTGSETVTESILVTSLPAVSRIGLRSVGPTPAQSVLNLEWLSPAAGRVRMTLLDVQGRRVGELLDEIHEVGAVRSTIALPASLRPGMYLLRCELPNVTETRRIVVTR